MTGFFVLCAKKKTGTPGFKTSNQASARQRRERIFSKLRHFASAHRVSQFTLS